MKKTILIIIAIYFFQSCVTWGGSDVQFKDIPKSQIKNESFGFCLTKMGFANVSPDLILSIKEGGKSAGVELVENESCNKDTKLLIHISSNNNDKSTATYSLNLLSAATIGLFPFVPSWSEVNLIIQWKPTKEPVVIQRYYAREKFLGSFWFHNLWWRQAYPNRIASEVLKTGTEHFISTMNSKQEYFYKKIRTKNGRTYYMVSIEKNLKGEIIRDFYGSEINLGSDSIDQKQILDQEIPL